MKTSLLPHCSDITTEGTARDLHRERETSGQRDQNTLLQDHAGVLHLVRVS